jgi:hypothetical protein
MFEIKNKIKKVDIQVTGIILPFSGIDGFIGTFIFFIKFN